MIDPNVDDTVHGTVSNLIYRKLPEEVCDAHIAVDTAADDSMCLTTIASVLYSASPHLMVIGLAELTVCLCHFETD